LRWPEHERRRSWQRKLHLRQLCAAPLLAVSAVSAGSNCVYLLPTPRELEASAAPIWLPPRPFGGRLPIVFLAKRSRRSTLAGQAALDRRAAWLNVSRARAEGEFGRYKYLLDVGGASGTTSGALRAKLLSGALVLKVETKWAEWWHHTLAPLRDYLPVKPDLSDLYDRYLWAEAHPAAAERIARSGARAAAATSGPRAARAAVASALWRAAEAARGGQQRRRPFPEPLRRFDTSCA